MCVGCAVHLGVAADFSCVLGRSPRSSEEEGPAGPV